MPRRKMVAVLKIEASRRAQGKKTAFKFHEQAVTREHLERSKRIYQMDLDEMDALESPGSPEGIVSRTVRFVMTSSPNSF